MLRLWTLFLLLTLAACSKAQFAEPMDAKKPVAVDGRHGSMAYEHGLRLDVEESKVPVLYEAALTACHAAGEGCDVLESNLSAGGSVSARLRLRTTPKVTQDIIGALGRQAKIADRWTKAEDLAGPIADGAKKLAMLKDYRAKLEALASRSGNGVDALIKINHELALTQSEIESAEGSQAALMRRVQTELLQISIDSQEDRSFWKPIGQAFAGFGNSLSDGISIAVTACAYLLPWFVLFLLLGAFVRWLWRRRRRA